jgi:tetratricopeptide (TPR) repeat protein
VAESGERGPAGQFRRLFTELTETLTHDDPARLERLRTAALQVAAAQQWFDQCAVVQLLAGAAYLKWQSPEPALAAYRQATQAGRQAQAAGHPAGNKLVVNGLFGEASAYLSRAEHVEAAGCYAQAATFAEADRDGILAVEAWRMQGYCLASVHRLEPAVEAGFRALDAGLWIEPAMRANSNLQLVAQWLLQQTGFFRTLHKRRADLVPRLEVLYGAGWPDTIKPLPPEDVSHQMMAAVREEDV